MVRRSLFFVHSALVLVLIGACGTFSVDDESPGGRSPGSLDGGGDAGKSPTGSSGSSTGTSSSGAGSSSGALDPDGATPPDPCALSLADVDCSQGAQRFHCAGDTQANQGEVSLTRDGNEISALWARTQLARSQKYVVQLDVAILADGSNDPDVGDGFAFSFLDPTDDFPTVSPAVMGAATLGVSALQNASGHAAFWRTVDAQTARTGNYRFSTSAIPGQEEQKLDHWNDAGAAVPETFEASRGTRVRVVITHPAGAAQASVRFFRVNDDGVFDVGSELALEVPDVTGFVGVSASTGYKSQHSAQLVTGLSIACPP